MAKMIHSMIRVVNEERSVQFYERAFALTIADRFDFDDFTLIYLRGEDSSFELELTVNKGHDAYDIGNGYGHLAVSVEDLDGEHARLQHEGLNPGALREIKHGGATLGRFFFITDPDGYKIEILQRTGRFAA